MVEIATAAVHQTGNQRFPRRPGAGQRPAERAGAVVQIDGFIAVLLRVGKRGEGKFEQISWEEALDTIASNMQRLIKEYGNESIYLNYGTGTLGGTLTRSVEIATAAVH